MNDSVPRKIGIVAVCCLSRVDESERQVRQPASMAFRGSKKKKRTDGRASSSNDDEPQLFRVKKRPSSGRYQRQHPPMADGAMA